MPEPPSRRRAIPVACAILACAVALAGLELTHHAAAAPLPPRVAIRDARQAPAVITALHGLGPTRASASPLDGSLERVSFLAGSRTVAEVAIARSGRADQVEVFARGVPAGNWLAYEPAMLLALSLVFVLMTAVLPLWRWRNLDVLAVLSLVVTVPLFQHGYLGASEIVLVPGSLFLLGRCVRRGLGGPLAAPAPAPAAETPLLDRLTARWDAGRRSRALRLLLLILAAVLVMVGVGTPTALDVPYAVMEGATVMLHGLLPYGHLPGDVIHGDTYPILSYALYVPLAAIAPVHSVFDSIYAALIVAVAAALGSAVLLVRWVAGAGGSGGDGEPGLRAAIAWLSFPPLLIAASTGTTDVALGLMLLAAAVLLRRPGASTAVLAVAGWFKLAPFALLPMWLAPRRGRALRHAIAAVAVVSLACLALLVGLGGAGGPAAMVRAVAYQFTRGSLLSPWVALHLPAGQPVAEAATLGLIAGLTAWLVLHPGATAEPQRIAALAAAVIIALELSASYWTLLYLTWFMPLLIGSLLFDVSPPDAASPPQRARGRRRLAPGALRRFRDVHHGRPAGVRSVQRIWTP